MLSILNSAVTLIAIIFFILYALVHIPVYLLYKRWGYNKAWLAFFYSIASICYCRIK